MRLSNIPAEHSDAKMKAEKGIIVGWLGPKWTVHALYRNETPMCRPGHSDSVNPYNGFGQLRDLTCRNCIRIVSGCGYWSAVDGIAREFRETETANTDSDYITAASVVRYSRMNPKGRRMPVLFQVPR